MRVPVEETKEVRAAQPATRICCSAFLGLLETHTLLLLLLLLLLPLLTTIYCHYPPTPTLYPPPLHLHYTLYPRTTRARNPGVLGGA